MRNTIKIAITVMAFVALLPLGASAESLVVNYGTVTNVPITLNGSAVNEGTAEFQTNLKDNQGNLLRDSQGNVATFTGFCVDPYQSIGKETVAVTLVAPSQVKGGLEAAWLIENRKSYQTVNSAWSAKETIALQVAIWEIIVDKDKGYDLTTGNFTLQASANTQVRDLASYYLSSLANFQATAQLDSSYRIAQSSTKQDLLLNIPGASNLPSTAAVPEPGTLILLGLGLLGIFGISRKRGN